MSPAAPEVREKYKRRSSSLSTAGSPGPGSTINVGKVVPSTVYKVHQESTGPKFVLCLIPAKRGRYGWRHDVYWVHQDCLSAHALQYEVTKVEQNQNTGDEFLSTKDRGFQTVLPEGLNHNLRDMNFKAMPVNFAENSNKSLHFEAKELDHMSRLSEGSEDEEQDHDPETHFQGAELSQNGSSVASKSPMKHQQHPNYSMLEEAPLDGSYLGKRAPSKSQSTSIRPKRNQNKPASHGKMHEEKMMAMNHVMRPKLEQPPLHKDFDEIYPRTMSDLRYFEVVGVSGVNYFNEEKYYSVILKHKKESTMRVMRILTGEELAAILEAN